MEEEEGNGDCSDCAGKIPAPRKEAVCAGLLKNSLALQVQRLRESVLCDFEDEEFQ